MSTQTVMGIPQTAAVSLSSISAFGSFDVLLHHRRRREVRSQKVIMAAILEACRTPTVQHWIMVKARLGYDTFRKHMTELVSMGMMNTLSDGNKTLYSINERGLSLLQRLSTE